MISDNKPNLFSYSNKIQCIVKSKTTYASIIWLVCVCVCVRVFVTYEDTNLYNDIGITRKR